MLTNDGVSGITPKFTGRRQVACHLSDRDSPLRVQFFVMPFFKDGDDYVFELESELYRTKALAFCFDADDGTLIKHGDEQRICDYAKTMRKKLVQSGNADIGAALTVVASQEWDIDLINRFLDCTGSILSWWNGRTVKA